MGILGILLSIPLIIIMAYRGWGMIPASLVSSIVVVIFSKGDIWVSLSQDYAGGLTYFAGAYFFIFILGSLFGQVMGDTGSATSISYKILKIFGKKRAVLIVTLATAILTYGGINLFIVIFTVYPIAKILFKSANLPKRLIAACIALGGATFTMTALPASPSIQNIIPTQVLGTTTSAAPLIGVIAAILLFGGGYLYLQNQANKIIAGKNECNETAVTDLAFDTEDNSLPDWKIALIPIVMVIGIIIILKNRFEPMYGVSIALTIGIVSAFIMNLKQLKNPLTTLNTGTGNSIMPLINTSCVVAFGFVVRGVPAFQSFVEYALSLDFHPYISAAIAVNIISGIVGSASGGLTIFMKTMGQHYVDIGVNPEILHRITALASGGLDSLPHSGAIITVFSVMGLTHKEAYKDVGFVTVIIPIIVTAIIIGISIMVY